MAGRYTEHERISCTWWEKKQNTHTKKQKTEAKDPFMRRSSRADQSVTMRWDVPCPRRQNEPSHVLEIIMSRPQCWEQRHIHVWNVTECHTYSPGVCFRYAENTMGIFKTRPPLTQNAVKCPITTTKSSHKGVFCKKEGKNRFLLHFPPESHSRIHFHILCISAKWERYIFFTLLRKKGTLKLVRSIAMIGSIKPELSSFIKLIALTIG